MKRLISYLTVIGTLLMTLSLGVAAACSHDSTHTEYRAENANDHSYYAVCDSCGEELYGWQYSGWGTHSLDSLGTCEVCGYTAECQHTSTHTAYQAENANDHSYYAVCDSCGESLYGWQYSGWSNHSLDSRGYCSACGYLAGCTHSSTYRVYTSESSTEHSYYTACNGCDETFRSGSYSGSESHSFSGDTCSDCGYTKSCSHSSYTTHYSEYSSSKHKTYRECDSCGAIFDEGYSSHSFSGNTCTSCGYTKAPAITASVSMSASGPSGSLDSGGGEIVSETFPASYSVTATAVGCNVTRIEYYYNNQYMTEYGNSVSITANTKDVRPERVR